MRFSVLRRWTKEGLINLTCDDICLYFEILNNNSLNINSVKIVYAKRTLLLSVGNAVSGTMAAIQNRDRQEQALAY